MLLLFSYHSRLRMISEALELYVEGGRVSHSWCMWAVGTVNGRLGEGRDGGGEWYACGPKPRGWSHVGRSRSTSWVRGDTLMTPDHSTFYVINFQSDQLPEWEVIHWWHPITPPSTWSTSRVINFQSERWYTDDTRSLHLLRDQHPEWSTSRVRGDTLMTPDHSTFYVINFQSERWYTDDTRSLHLLRDQLPEWSTSRVRGDTLMTPDHSTFYVINFG